MYRYFLFLVFLILPNLVLADSVGACKRPTDQEIKKAYKSDVYEIAQSLEFKEVKCVKENESFGDNIWINKTLMFSDIPYDQHREINEDTRFRGLIINFVEVNKNTHPQKFFEDAKNFGLPDNLINYDQYSVELINEKNVHSYSFSNELEYSCGARWYENRNEVQNVTLFFRNFEKEDAQQTCKKLQSILETKL
ncbi:MAG: hypothetical protein KDI13_09810 [Alphaproteobacteria bacterium]|nr:hypothetical protein [Alphaproteobacteria bacterium]